MRDLRIADRLRSLRGEYDFGLTLLTVGLVTLVGALFVAATVYTFFAARANPFWTESTEYAAYISSMNSFLFPLLAGLVLTLGLCIPRRILTRRALLVASLVMLGATALLIPLAGLAVAWAFLLGSAALIQLIVIILTAARSRQVRYVQEAFLVRIGSALLHLGFIVLVAAFVTGVPPALQLTIFWVATGLIMTGMTMSFYSSELSGLLRRRQATRGVLEEA